MSDYYNNSAANNGCFDWDDEIQNDGQEFITLPEGDYVFEVVDFERGRYPASAKIPPCNKASLTLQVKTPDGIARILAHVRDWSEVSSLLLQQPPVAAPCCRP